MIHIKAVVRNPRKDGMYPVYIRVIHDRKIAYLKTDKLVAKEGIGANKEVVDGIVLVALSNYITESYRRLNAINTSNLTLDEVVSIVRGDGTDICFSDFARTFIDRHRRGDTRDNYIIALRSLESFVGSDKVMCKQLTSILLNKWIDKLGRERSMAQAYPLRMRAVCKAIDKQYNDHDNNKIVYNYNTWLRVDIPKVVSSRKCAISVEELRAFFKLKPRRANEIIAYDLAKISFCLAGMNAVDLFRLKKDSYYDGIIHYNRAKTQGKRADNAYMEIRVPNIIKDLIEHYRAKEGSEYLLRFGDEKRSSRDLTKSIVWGFRSINSWAGTNYIYYTFRHTWATIAQNDCGASISDVAFALNHSRGEQVTRGYIKVKFDQAWELNDRVVDYVFGEGSSHPVAEKKVVSLPPTPNVGDGDVAPTDVVYCAAYTGAEKVCEFTDFGFAGVDAIIQRVHSTLGARTGFILKITKIDTGEVVMRRL